MGGIDFENYCAEGGYKILRQCYDGKLSVQNVIDELDKSGLKDGGAGFLQAKNGNL